MHISRIETGPEPDKIQDTPDRSLAELESIVAKGLQTHQEVGAVLDEIHSRRLYKPQYKNFKTYLLERWGISRAQGYRLIAAAKLPKTEMSPNETQSAVKASEPKEKRAKRKPPVPADLDVESEFTAIRERVAEWAAEFAQDDYLNLVVNVKKWLEELLSEAGLVVVQSELAEVAV